MEDDARCEEDKEVEEEGREREEGREVQDDGFREVGDHGRQWCEVVVVVEISSMKGVVKRMR